MGNLFGKARQRRYVITGQKAQSGNWNESAGNNNCDKQEIRQASSTQDPKNTSGDKYRRDIDVQRRIDNARGETRIMFGAFASVQDNDREVVTCRRFRISSLAKRRRTNTDRSAIYKLQRKSWLISDV